MPIIEEAGDYTVAVKSAEFGESKTGTPFLALNFKTEDDHTITGWLYLTDKALPGTVKTLKEAFAFDGNFETAPAQVEGKPCRIKVELEDFEGKTRAKVKFVNHIDGGYKAKPIANAAAFLKGLSAKAAKLPPAAGAAPTRAAPSAPKAPAPKPAPKVETPDDDVPF
jgi:hypothetical protein